MRYNRYIISLIFLLLQYFSHAWLGGKIDATNKGNVKCSSSLLLSKLPLSIAQFYLSVTVSLSTNKALKYQLLTININAC